jgi:hypothetical protein
MNPIVVSIDEKQVRVTEINFPAVTICPGLILARDDYTYFDYDRIVSDLQHGKVSITDLTEHEWV